MRWLYQQLSAVLLPCLVWCSLAQAESIFSVRISSEGAQFSEDYNDQQAVFDQFSEFSLQRVIPAYNSNSAVDAQINYRGVPLNLNYVQNSTRLTLDIPDLPNIATQVFEGATRDESENQLEDFFKANTDGILNAIHKLLAQKSPVDPIAGNPQSLMGTLANNDFVMGTGIDIVAGTAFDIGQLPGSSNSPGQGIRSAQRNETYTVEALAKEDGNGNNYQRGQGSQRPNNDHAEAITNTQRQSTSRSHAHGHTNSSTISDSSKQTIDNKGHQGVSDFEGIGNIDPMNPMDEARQNNNNMLTPLAIRDLNESTLNDKDTQGEQLLSKEAILREVQADSEARQWSSSEASGNGSEGKRGEQYSENGASLDASVAQYSLNGIDSSVYNMVVDYKYRFDSDPRKQIRIKAPISYTDTDGAKTYSLAFAIAYGFPVQDNWNLSTGISYGVTGSEELGSAGALTGLSLASNYRFDVGKYQFAVGNMIANYDSGSIKIDEYEMDPGITNQVFRNGFAGMMPIGLWNTLMRAQLFLIDTRYSGDNLYTEHYYEVGIALGPDFDTRDITEGFKLGVTYLDSTDADINGFRLNYGYKF